MKGCIPEANPEGQGRNEHRPPPRRLQPGGRERGHPHTFYIGASRKFHAKPVCPFATKRTLKGLSYFVPQLLNSSDLSRYGSNLRKRHTKTIGVGGGGGGREG